MSDNTWHAASVCIAHALNDPYGADALNLKPDDFADDRHRTIWQAILDTEKPDCFKVGERLERLEPGRGWVETLMDMACEPSTVNATAYAALLRTAATRRRAVEIASGMIELLGQGDDSAVDQAIRSLQQLSTDTEVESVSIGTAARLAVEAMQQRRDGGAGVCSGIGSIDRTLGGLHPGDLVVIGARPGTGKTSLMLQMAMYSATHNVPVGVFSGEQAAPQLGERALSCTGKTTVSELRSGRANEVDLVEALENLDALPVHLADVSCPSIGFIRKMGRKWVKEHGVRAIFVDYLQRMTGDPRLPKHERVGNNARDLKTLAVELQIPVIVLAQVNRNVTGRTDPRPTMADLRDSGEIEQEADQIMLLYTDNSDEGSDVRDSEIILDKNRHGATGVFQLSWIGPRMLFRERADDPGYGTGYDRACA